MAPPHRLSSATSTWGLSTAASRFIIQKKPRFMIGADEVGYGALAGPYVVGAFFCPVDWMKDGVKDSKKFTGESGKKTRARLAQELMTFNKDTDWAIRYASHKEIDQNGKHPTLHGLFDKVIRELVMRTGIDPTETFIVLDGEVKITLPHFPVVDADANIPAVAAASIIAKVERDRWMTLQHEEWPGYGFDKHSGYGTPAHLEALKKNGPCEIHRRTYEPISSMVRGRR